MRKGYAVPPDFRKKLILAVFRRCFVKNFFRNFAKFTRKYLYQSLFLNKVTDFSYKLWHRCFPVNFAKFLQNIFLYRTHSVAASGHRTEGLKGVLSDLRKFFVTESFSKMMKNASYFTVKAFFVLKIFNFLPWLLGHLGCMVWLET